MSTPMEQKAPSRVSVGRGKCDASAVLEVFAVEPPPPGANLLEQMAHYIKRPIESFLDNC
jgi:hypothetical protein